MTIRTPAALALATALLGTHAFTPAHAIVTGGTLQYPLGSSLGLPAGAMPPTGFYMNLHPNGAQSSTVNAEGARTGAGSTSFGDFASFTYVPGIKILGATYAFHVGGLGILSVELHAPPYKSVGVTKNGVRATGTGMIDWSIAPLNLSWSLGSGWFFDFEFSAHLPAGQYDANNVINTGQNHYSLEPNIALTYLKDGYDLTSHLLTEIPLHNPSTGYSNGSFGILDVTTTKKFGRWTTGPVGMYWGQWSPDAGPAAMRAPYPVEIAAGWDLGYDLAPGIALNGWAIRDVYARSVASLAVRWQVNLLFKAF